MDYSKRQITKIAREVSKFTVQTMKEDGIGTAEFDFIHLLRHHPELTQAQIREELKIDKGAAARQAASLEAKGYLIRKENPADGRSQLLYATEKAENLRNSKVSLEQAFYEWLLSEPVSYTHLDVYKRQVLLNLFRLMVYLTLKEMLSLRIHRK